MALLNRLIGKEMTTEEEELGRLPIHEAIAAWGEYARSQIPFSDIAELQSRFNLTASEMVDLSNWTTAVGMGTFTLEELESVLHLASGGFMSPQECRIRLGLEAPPDPEASPPPAPGGAPGGK